MTAAPKNAPLYVSGHCGVGRHTFCRGEYAGTPCHCNCNHKPPGEAVNDQDAAVSGPAALTKDTTRNDGTLSPSGVPAASPRIIFSIVGDVELLSHDLAEILDDLHEIEALDALAQIRQARQGLAQIEATLERRAARVMTGDIIEWPGGVAERRFGKDRKEWQHDELIRTVVNLIATDVATDKASGELDDMLAALVQDAVARFAETHRPDWRVTVLKKLGVDPDEYCRAIPGRTTVAITQAGPQ